jgi:hypothetical protein
MKRNFLLKHFRKTISNLNTDLVPIYNTVSAVFILKQIKISLHHYSNHETISFDDIHRYL